MGVALAPDQLEARHRPADPGGEAERSTEAPHHDVSPREPDRQSVGPLVAGRDVARARHQLADLLHVRPPRRVEAEPEDPGSGERVRLQQAEHDERQDAGQHEVGEGSEQPATGAESLATSTREGAGDRRHHRHRRQQQQVELASHRRAQYCTESDVAARSAALEDRDREPQAEHDEGVGEGVDSEEMRLLDRQRGETEQQRREHPHLGSVQATAEQEGQEHADQTERRRQHPPDYVDGPVLGHVERDRDQPHEEDRQRAVDEEAVALVVRIERRRLRVEVLPHRLRQRERAGDHGEEALVGVEVLLVERDLAAGLDLGRGVPVQSTEAQRRRDRQHHQEGELPVEEAAPADL